MVQSVFLIMEKLLMLLKCQLCQKERRTKTSKWKSAFNEIKSHIINKSTRNIRVIVENVSAMPGQGVTSMFNFGQSFGVIKGICAAMQLPIHFCKTCKWKKHFNLINTEKMQVEPVLLKYFQRYLQKN